MINTECLTTISSCNAIFDSTHKIRVCSTHISYNRPQSSVFIKAANDAVKVQALGPEVVPVVGTALVGRSVIVGAVHLAMEAAVQSIRIVTRSS